MHFTESIDARKSMIPNKKKLLLQQIPNKKTKIKLSKRTIFLIATETFVIHKVEMSHTQHHPITL